MVEQIADLNAANRQVIPASLTIMALRDSRYHNTAYAISELIDNAVDANASRVELLCMERTETVNVRTLQTVSEIAVLDNGTGMTPRTLLEALKFGGGTRHQNQRGIGKYGMGLPTSSISQCVRLDVWTWQNDIKKPWHCHIDAKEIENGNDQVPIPDQETPLPDVWIEAALPESIDNQHGTLVRWTILDKIHWRRGRALIENTATEIGRIHRHSINEGRVTIRMASFPEDHPREPGHSNVVLPNDPLYLMPNTSTPEPWNAQPMFKEWATKHYSVNVLGREETIQVRYSIVRPEALRTSGVTQLPGAEPHGIHARHNIGVSVVREDREIVLEDAFLREGGSAENPQNRWWGCEVSFSRTCDELFGVDHNKQMAAHFTQAAKTLAQDDRPNQLILDEIGIEQDVIHTIVGDIRDQTRSMMREIRQMFAQRRDPQDNGTRGDRINPAALAAKTATDADRDAIATGIELPTGTDRDREQIPPEDRVAGLTEQFIKAGQADEDAGQLAKRLVEEALSYQFSPAQLDGFQMFNVRSSQGVLHINLNTDHPIYDLLKHIEDDLDENADESDPAFQASVAIRLLLSSWARMEDQTEARDERTRIQDIAMNWGRQVHKVINQLRERDG